jgi:hypothetical protein
MLSMKKLFKNRILWHLLFWLVVVVIHYKNMQLQGIEQHFWFFTWWLLPVELTAVYFTAYVLVPNLLLQRRFWAFAVSFAVSAVAFVLLERAIYYYVLYPAVYPEGLQRPFFYFLQLWFLGLNLYSFVFLFSGVRVYRSWVQEQRRQVELEKQNLSSELALLRSQVNPHFLFNTLNNIDLLVFKDQQKASDSIVKLSEIMRYMLYESNTDDVPLERELQYLQSLVDLMRLRVKDPDFIQFRIEGEPAGKRIPPMLLVPFIENAYKHGKKTGRPPGILINFKIEPETYSFSVRNRVENRIPVAKDRTGGIGLNNVRRRLKLLYDQDYSLRIEQVEEWYEVELVFPWRNA